MTTATPSQPTDTRTITIVETMTAGGGSLRIDRERGVISGVKVIGTESKNGRDYPAAMLQAHAHVYEGAKVNLNHPEKSPTQPRTYQDRFGALRNARFESGGIVADFHYNPKHPIAEQFAWDAEHSPEAMGFSHNATLRMRPPANGRQVVESILSVKSVDLVADPATTKSLFEHIEATEMDDGMNPAPAAPEVDSKAAAKSAFRDLIMSKVDDESLDMKATLAAVKDIMKAQEKLMGGGTAAPSDGGDDDAEEQVTSLRLQLQNVTQQLEQVQQRETQEKHAKLVETKLEAAGLDRKNPLHVSDLFATQLLGAQDEQALEALIKDRADAIGDARKRGGYSSPRSSSVHDTTEGAGGGGGMTPQQFASRLRGV